MPKCSNTSNPRRLSRLRRRPLGRYRYVRLRWRVLFAAVDFVGGWLFCIARAVRAPFRTTIAFGLRLCGMDRGSSAVDPEPRTILLVQLDHLGDAVISTVMLGPLWRRFPKASIEVLCGPWNREVFEACPEVDRVHVSRVNRFARGGRARLIWVLSVFWWGFRLRRRRIDVAIDVRGEFPIALMLWLSGARRRVGWACGGGRFLLTEGPRFVLDRPEAQSRLALLNTLGIRTATGDGVRLPRLPVADGACRRVDRWLAEQFPTGSPPDRLFVVHVGSGMPAKQWPAEHWRELIRHLAAARGAQVVLVGSEADRIIAARILAGRPCENVADATGRLRIAELAALAERACVFVGADSGPAHVAAAVGTPVVVLFSGTNSSRQWRPAGPWVRVVRHPVPCGPCHRQACPLPQHPCMREIRPSAVLQAVWDLLGRAKQSHARGTPPPDRDRKGVRDDCPAASG